ncbi:hypothetical protein [Herbiconiux sp. YIM B11900]|uniref:hypothetical protein n=1 Tax=Herbiconiux sp. YIM B11900 TaxID=3404131 RepID=UPI003F8345A8
MTEDAPHTLSRRTVVGAAWAAPVVLAAIAVPAAAASEDTRRLVLDVSPPSQDGPLTRYLIRVTNDSDTDIPAGGLLATLPYSPDGYFFAGFSGDISWNYGTFDDSGDTPFAYYATIPAHDTAGPLLMYLGKRTSGQTPPPVATLTFTATGFRSESTALPVTYG